ncbi:MAG: hypothetical protein KDC13_08000 [Bacteroidetes bacterium]|nr:hypothetical protein [Bacteroidota bacterium]
MKQLLITGFLLLCLNSGAQTFNQNTCQDTTLISNNPCYGTSYQPVCGCDNVTYRNECLAYANGLLNFTQGPCEFMDFDFLPNPVATIGQLQVKVVCKGITDINVWIFDTFFRQKYYERHLQFQEIDLYPDVRGFGNGLFFIVVEANGVVKVKRLLVNQLN